MVFDFGTGSGRVVTKTSGSGTGRVQSGQSSLAEHGGAYFSAISGSIKDPIATPGPYENEEV